MIDQIAVRQPRLLDKNLYELRRLNARTQSVELNITPLSSASLTVDDGSGVGIRSFVELYNAKGSVGVFRVSMPDESYGSGERLSLEHGICVLDDAVVHGRGEIKGTPRSVISKILTYQTTKARNQNIWTLGTIDAPDNMTITVEHDGTKTLEVLMRAMDELQDYMLTFDQSVFPWKLNVRRKPQGVSCEGRLSRNIRTIRKTLDDSDLCTRLHCSLLDNGYIDSDTKDTWGIVEKNITLNDGMEKSDVLAYCRRYLNNRKNPIVSIEIDATEWYKMTGEQLDRFEVGDMCRIALPEYGVVIEERIVSLNYADAIGAPESVTASLANPIADLSIKTANTTQAVNNLQHTSTNYGNRIATSETNITNLKDAQDDIEEINGKMTHWFSSVEINLDAQEDSAKFGALASYRQLTDVSDRVSTAELTLYGDGTSARAGLVASVNENAASIEAIVDGETSVITLTALNIKLNGYVTVQKLEAERAEIEKSISDIVTTDTLNVLKKANFTSNAINVGRQDLKLLTRTIDGTTIHYLGYE